MSETETPSTAGDTKPCKVCGEPIKKVARVCIHCNNYQDWRADLSISNTVLTLLVALFSVLTVALPAITTFITPKNSNIIFSLQGSLGQTIGLLVTNTGIRPGAVHFLQVTRQGNPVVYPFNLSQPSAAGGNTAASKNDASVVARVIEPGKSELVSFNMPVNFTNAFGQIANNAAPTCNLNLFGTDFFGAITNKQVTTECILLVQPYGPPPAVLPMPNQH